MSTESASRKSGPPHASSLAAPPEFYADENTVTRSVRNLLTGLGRLQVFLLPGQARAAELVELVEANLTQICAIASTRQPGTWRLTSRGPQPFDTAERRPKPRKRGSGQAVPDA